MRMDSGDLSQEISDAFDEVCQAKHDVGLKKYGSARFLEVDSIAMAMDEIVDFSNYARFTYIKLTMLQAWALQFQTEIGTFLRFKEEFKLFMLDKGVDIDELPPEIEPPNEDDPSNRAIDLGVPFAEGAAQQVDGFFSPYRKQQ